MARGLYYGSFKQPRGLLWSIGVIIFLVMIITAFLGYVLPYGQMSLWGATVITNLMSAIPWIGQDIVSFIWGGFAVDNATLNRFFSLHYLLPFVLTALIIMHLMALHQHGSSNPLGITGNVDRLPMHPYFTFKDLVTVFIFFFIFSYFVFFSPNTLGQRWPFLTMMLLGSKCAICWKYLCYLTIYNKTINVSGFLYPVKVKYYYIIARSSFAILAYKCNQQITNVITLFINILQVGISETTRTQKRNIKHFNLSSNLNNNLVDKSSIKECNLSSKLTSQEKREVLFNEWLAGLIDGDGYLLVTKEGFTGCEITVALEDEKMLRVIQDKLGGSIKLRSGAKAMRYRLQNKIGMINLINRINGLVRNSKRLPQLFKVCDALGITPKTPELLTIESAWFMGFFDADGTINYYYQNQYTNNKPRPQLTVSVTNKYYNDVLPFKEILGGNIYFDKAQNGYYKWSINSKELHMHFYNQFLKYPSKSVKSKRVFLIKEYYDLMGIKAHISDDNTSLYKAWIQFENKWK
jgi:ubiquinol-cytochrome c reductase cytochrome b subunit